MKPICSTQVSLRVQNTCQIWLLFHSLPTDIEVYKYHSLLPSLFQQQQNPRPTLLRADSISTVLASPVCPGLVIDPRRGRAWTTNTRKVRRLFSVSERSTKKRSVPLVKGITVLLLKSVKRFTENDRGQTISGGGTPI